MTSDAPVEFGESVLLEHHSGSPTPTLFQFVSPDHNHTCRQTVAPLCDVCSVVTDQWFFCCRCNSEHATSSAASGGDGVEANPAAPHHCSRNLPAASGKPLHLEERVPGSYGEVRMKEKGRIHYGVFISSRSKSVWTMMK